MKKVIVRRTYHNTLETSVSLHPLLQRIYVARGISQARDIERGLDCLLPYEQLRGIKDAVLCLSHALMQQQRILVIGDFDADGATSSALAVKALRALGAPHVDYLVPNRFEYGYGLTPEIVQVAAKRAPQLIITVDNGIASLEGVKVAKALGMQVLITDHHLPGPALPSADAIVNPNQPGDSFGSKCLAGVGVIFYVMLALRAHLKEIGWFISRPLPNMAQFLDLVALGTVADLVPLDANNRILVYQGIKRIQLGQCSPGILALLEVANRSYQRLTAADLAYAVGPRLNAAGRLDDMSLGIACLLTNDYREAKSKAMQLDNLNLERRTIEKDMQQQALIYLNDIMTQSAEDLPIGLCLYQEQWHQGVIGILAARIKDKFQRPVIAFAKSNHAEIKGSARSIEGIHIRDVLDGIATRHPGLIRNFGGHAMAAGISLAKEHFIDFSKAFNDAIQRQIDPSLLQGKIYSDGELTEQEFSLEIAEMLRDAGPWGQAFPEPLFDGYFTIIEKRIIQNKHLKLSLQQKEGRCLEAIAFNSIDSIEADTKHIHAAYRLDINEFRGQRNLQLVIEHLKPL